jgi:hypothetical protein
MYTGETFLLKYCIAKKERIEISEISLQFSKKKSHLGLRRVEGRNNLRAEIMNYQMEITK